MPCLLHEIENGVSNVQLFRFLRVVPIDAVERHEAHELRDVQHVGVVGPGYADADIDDNGPVDSLRISELICPAIAVNVAAVRGDDEEIVGKRAPSAP